jgi:type IV pilus assembly protein PilM
MSIHFSLSHAKSLTVGIDLGLDAAKVICLKATKSGYELKAHALLKRDQLGALKEFLHHSSLRQAHVRLAIQVPQLKVQKVTVPIVPREELGQVVTWAFKEATSLPIDEYIVRYYQMGAESQGDNKQTYTAFAIEKTFFEKWREFIGKAGIIHPKMAEPDIQSLANTAIHNYGNKEGYRFAVIDIGKAQSQMAVVSQNGIEFFRPFSGIGGDQLASGLGVELGISTEDAERRLLDIAHDVPCEKQDEIQDFINGYCAKFCVQAQYAIEQYASTSKESPITNILLAGGGAKLKGLREQIQETLHFPTDLINPFARIDLGRFAGRNFDSSKTIYAIATGLAL